MTVTLPTKFVTVSARYTMIPMQNAASQLEPTISVNVTVGVNISPSGTSNA
jgi:hypothetical protein